MGKKVVSAMMLTVLLVISMLTLACNIQPVKAGGTIYIRADGSVDPPTVAIQRVGNVYTFTNNISDSIVVEKDDIVVDGAGYTQQGGGTGIDLSGRSNVVIKNVELRGFGTGILMSERIIDMRFEYSSNNKIIGNSINSYYTGIELTHSSYNSIYGNSIYGCTRYGIDLRYSSNHNIICGNNITRNMPYASGIDLSQSDYNSVIGNDMTDNGYGIVLSGSSHNSICENNIANNGDGLHLTLYFEPGENSIYHNNFLNNTEQVHFAYVLHLGQPITSFNVWDDGYPSGGNYWSDYNGTDSYSGAYQNETGSDAIGDTVYFMDADNLDNYPLMSLWTPPEHELVTAVTAPTFMRLGDTISLEAIITNEGLNEEANVELELLVNGTIVGSTTIPTLKTYFPHTLGHLWTPAIVGPYNVTAYAHPVSGETSIENNKVAKTVIVGPAIEVGVKAGDWIKCDYTVIGAPSGTAVPTWTRVEFLSVEETTTTACVMLHMSDGTEQNETMNVDVVVGSGTIGTFTGFLIPANSTTGYPIYISGYSNLTIAGETTRTYAGASRTVVYASFSQYGTQLTYYWDKQTGVIVEASAKMGGMTATAKVTETNMWEAAPFWMQWWLWAIVVVVIVALAGAVYLKKRKPPTTQLSPETTE